MMTTHIFFLSIIDDYLKFINNILHMGSDSDPLVWVFGITSISVILFIVGIGFKLLLNVVTNMDSEEKSVSNNKSFHTRHSKEDLEKEFKGE